MKHAILTCVADDMKCVALVYLCIAIATCVVIVACVVLAVLKVRTEPQRAGDGLIISGPPHPGHLTSVQAVPLAVADSVYTHVGVCAGCGALLNLDAAECGPTVAEKGTTP